MSTCPDGAPAVDPFQRLVLFRMETQDYALPLERVESVIPVVEVSPLPKGPAIALGIINLHGRVVPVLDIRSRFGRPPQGESLSGHLLIAHTQRQTVALPVDEVTGIKPVAAGDITPPDQVLPGTEHLLGVVTLPDGLVFIQDLDAFLSLAEEEHLARALQGDQE